MMERTAKRLQNFEVKLHAQKAELKRARQTIRQTADWKVAVVEQITQLADLSADAPLTVQSALQQLLETALDGPPCEMEDESTVVSPTPTETTDEEEVEEGPKEKFNYNAHDEAVFLHLHPSESPRPFNPPLGGGLPIAEIKHPPPDTRLLKLENGESNCFVIAALHVLQAMWAVASGLLHVSADSPRCLRALSDVLNHRTHSVNALRGLLGADFSEGYGDVKDVLEHILTNWIPPELQSHFRFHVSKTTTCEHKLPIKQRNNSRLVLHLSINRDDFLEDVVEHDKPVMCNACDDVATVRVQLTANTTFKYLIVLLHNRDRCDVQIRGDVVQMFGRRMQVNAAVQYKKSEKHYVVWRRVDDRRNPWRLVDSLEKEPIIEKFPETLRDVSVLVLELLPDGQNKLEDGLPTSIDDDDVILID